MTRYFTPDILENAKKQRKRVLRVYWIFLGVYLLASAGVMIYYLTHHFYMSPIGKTVRWIEFPLTAVFIIFSFIYLGIPYKRVNKYYKLCMLIQEGLNESCVATYLRTDETITSKDGVDFKSLVFSVWNKYRNVFFERKVLVFYELEFPRLEEGTVYKFVTQGNVLLEYEIYNNLEEGK